MPPVLTVTTQTGYDKNILVHTDVVTWVELICREVSLSEYSSIRISCLISGGP